MKRLGLDGTAPVKRPGPYRGDKGQGGRAPRGQETTFEEAMRNEGVLRDEWKEACDPHGRKR